MSLRTLLLIVLGFAGILLPFALPILEGKRLLPPDIEGWMHQVYPMLQWEEKTGEKPLWLWHMFSGMPAGMIYNPYPSWFHQFQREVLMEVLPPPLFMFVVGLCFSFVLVWVLTRNPWISFTLAVAYTFAVFHVISLIAGHFTKVIAGMALPGLFAGVLLYFQGRRWTGLLVFFLAFTILWTARHPQVTYYAVLGFILLAPFFLVHFWKHNASGDSPGKRSFHLLIAGGLFLIPVGIVVLADLPRYWMLLEVTPHTIRGKASELAPERARHREGLDFDYAFQWSYGVWETATLFVPRAAGGSVREPLPRNSYLARELRKIGVPPAQVEQIRSHAPVYWGALPSTDGPIYMGILVMFFAIAGITLGIRRKHWLLLGATIVLGISIMLAWGKHFILGPLAFSYLPLFNKFRTPMMIFMLAQVMLLILAGAGWYALFSDSISREERKRLWKTAFVITLLVPAGALLFGFLAGKGTFSGPQDELIARQAGDAFVTILQEQRRRLLISDSLRSILWVLLGAGVIFRYLMGKMSARTALLIAGLVLAGDVLWFAWHYYDKSVFRRPRPWNRLLHPTHVDRQLLQDTTYFRVANFSVNNPFVDSRTPYFHKSIGGYLPARLRIYQDLMDSHLLVQNMNAYHMLNVKYFIVPAREKEGFQVVVNPQRCGPAWFPRKLIFVPDVRNMSRALYQYSPCEVGVLLQSVHGHLQKWGITTDTWSTSAQVELIHASPNRMIYRISTREPRILVLSEIYYPVGWRAYIQGRPDNLLPIWRVNFALRGIPVPAGTHELVMEFRPPSIERGVPLQKAGNVLWMLMLVVFTGGWFLLRTRKPEIPVLTAWENRRPWVQILPDR